MSTTVYMTRKPTKEEKPEILQKYRDFHAPYLTASDIPQKDFNIKSVFYFEGQKVVGIFENEFLKTKGFYFEIIDSFLNPVDPKRTIYRVPPRENFAEVYQYIPDYRTYAVPLEELEVVSFTLADDADLSNPPGIKIKKEEPVKEKTFKKYDSDTDEHYSKLTIRDLAAILWQKPVSTKDWLNELVENQTSK